MAALQEMIFSLVKAAEAVPAPPPAKKEVVAVAAAPTWATGAE
jgi:hypothetical protein